MKKSIGSPSRVPPCQKSAGAATRRSANRRPSRSGSHCPGSFLDAVSAVVKGVLSGRGRAPAGDEAVPEAEEAEVDEGHVDLFSGEFRGFPVPVLEMDRDL